MLVLAFGVVAFAAIHLFKVLAPDVRSEAVRRLGPGPFRGLIALLLLLSVACMIEGYHTAQVVPVYNPPWWGGAVTFPLMVIAFVLFVSARAPTNIKRVVRHPQLTSIVVWAVAHLMANGDAEDLILFGGLGVWALAEMALINRREGEWVKPEKMPALKDMVTLVIALAVFLVVAWIHLRLLGIKLF